MDYLVHYLLVSILTDWSERSFFSHSKEKGEQGIFENQSSSSASNKHIWRGIFLYFVNCGKFTNVARVRNALSYATHKFFQENGFVWVSSPIITASDCEGAGEQLCVTTLVLPLSSCHFI
ncbi:hypothetical protein GIB67_001243 [Kingdonia uniflora]|uniref:Uncharacterized protein n=1 Tax=Kingdonia uniflora TaxID=39325 RepID=A0A7J7LG94_9MAGN|nr:hypothetical protein GIB67_001243 [Kingdonia uniflora]